MADQLTDEEKAKLVLGDVESVADETTEENKPDPDPANETPEEEAEEQPEEEEASESEEETPEAKPQFTKQFPNLKGDTPEEYITEVEKAYENSTNEALRLKKAFDDFRAEVEAKLSQSTTPPDPATPPAAPAAPVATNPDLVWAKQLREDAMISAFDSFKKDYPQALEGEEFQKFLNASKGVEDAFKASHDNRLPTYPELYKGIASVLGWSPIRPKKDAAIKEAAASPQTVSATQPVSKQPKVTEAQVDAYLKMYPGKANDRASVIKELSAAVT